MICPFIDNPSSCEIRVIRSLHSRNVSFEVIIVNYAGWFKARM
jgi:hypothetical protein